MQLLETAKFRKQRERLQGEKEKESLKKSIQRILEDPAAGKKMNGELMPFHIYRCTVAGRPQRLIYQLAADSLVLFSFGPRHVAFKP
ncbi:MAG TPA: type II toxin-antitoxin system RelE/ParE family toxin [Candidatus Binatia bacterium]|jgi:O-glycosyl hydrolase|nr:type II toxin-antitoxin system RelE/ParE family toxin [Candidatus Binatia bacterium]